MLVRHASGILIVAMVAATTIACRPSDDASYTVQRIALDTLFNGREHARQLVIWSSDSAGPALEGILSQHPTQSRVNIEQLRPTLPAAAIDEQALTNLFREHPDGWEEFFTRYPRSSGLVELSPVHFTSRNAAETYVGRSCGEHCRNAWRIVARRDASGTWKVAELQWIRVP
jgi:hypothetical protein